MNAKLLVGISVILSILAFVVGPIPLIGTAIQAIFLIIANLFFFAGVIIWFSGKKRLGPLSMLKRLSFNRHDIITSTNWARLDAAEFAKPIGISLTVIGTILLIVEIIIGSPYPLLYLWIMIIIVGLLLYLWRPSSISYDITKRIQIKIPDLFSVHTFHTNLRQSIEDIGYVIAENISPGESSSLSRFNNNIFLLNGGIKAERKSITPSKLLIPETEESIMSSIFSLFGFSILLIFLGLTLFIHTTTTWQFESWVEIVKIIAILLLSIGSIMLLYDYITRTRKIGQIYVIEEGTVYIPTINIYNTKKQSTTNQPIQIQPILPNISFMHTSCELIVTIGAARNKFYEESKLQEEFNKITATIENSIKENLLPFKNLDSMNIDTNIQENGCE